MTGHYRSKIEFVRVIDSNDVQALMRIAFPQDQNENQATHEIEILKGIMSTVRDLQVTSTSLSVGDIVSRACRRTPAKVGQHSMLSLTKYYLKHLEDDSGYLAEELIDYHCQTVNPKDLVVSSNFFQTLALEPGFERVPLVRHYLTLTQYTKEIYWHNPSTTLHNPTTRPQTTSANPYPAN